MTKYDIFLYSLDQAVRNGFDGKDFRIAFQNSPVLPDGTNLTIQALSETPHALIFNHKFLKAFFGDGDIKLGSMVIGKIWEKHAKDMVINEEPLKYLEKYLTAPSVTNNGQENNESL